MKIIERLSALEKPAVVLTVGLPGSGKTTLLAAVREAGEREGLNLGVVSPDDVRDELAGTGKRQAGYDPDLNSKVFGIVNARVRGILQSGGVAIVDGTHLSRNPESTFRPPAVEKYRELGARTVAALVLDVPVEVAQARNAARGAAGEGYVVPEDIDGMEAFRRAHPLTLEAPAEFDAVIPAIVEESI